MPEPKPEDYVKALKFYEQLQAFSKKLIQFTTQKIQLLHAYIANKGKLPKKPSPGSDGPPSKPGDGHKL